MSSCVHGLSVKAVSHLLCACSVSQGWSVLFICFQETLDYLELLQVSLRLSWSLTEHHRVKRLTVWRAGGRSLIVERFTHGGAQHKLPSDKQLRRMQTDTLSCSLMGLRRLCGNLCLEQRKKKCASWGRGSSDVNMMETSVRKRGERRFHPEGRTSRVSET